MLDLSFIFGEIGILIGFPILEDRDHPLIRWHRSTSLPGGKFRPPFTLSSLMLSGYRDAVRAQVHFLIRRTRVGQYAGVSLVVRSNNQTVPGNGPEGFTIFVRRERTTGRQMFQRQAIICLHALGSHSPFPIETL